MKKKLIVILSVILVYMIFSSYSCTNGSSQSEYPNLSTQDSIFVITQNDSVEMMFSPITQNKENEKLVGSSVSPQTVIFEKEFQPMQIDTNIKIKKDKQYQKLEKTEESIKMQQAAMDSLIMKKQQRKK